MRPRPGNDLNLGSIAGTNSPLVMSRRDRSTHLYVCGSTGTGKSKFLEHLIRQDIREWHKNKCGLLLLDPHGSLYDGLIRWLAWHDIDRPVIPIDLRQDDWVVAYNVLRQRPQSDPAVLVNNFVQAMAHVWGESGTERTPLFARWASNVLRALYEKKHTLIEAQYLLDRKATRIRFELTQNLSDRSVAQDWAFANTLSPEHFDAQVSSTVSRFRPFLSTQLLQRIFGQPGASLDLATALNEGHIILVNVATEKNRVSEADAALFATLLLTDLWTAAKERGKGTDERDVKSFYVYIDEFQNFVTPTIAKNLDEARGFGLHLTLANQFPRQILHAGANGAQVYDSVKENARSKVVFSLADEENLKPLAQALFMGTMNPDEIKLSLYSRKVKEYVEETRTTQSTSDNWSDGTGEFTGATDTESTGGAVSGAGEDSSLWNQSGATSRGTSRTSMRGGGRGESTVPFLKPVFGEELSSVQFRSLEEQLFRAMAVLFDQRQRQCVVRLVETPRPVSLHTPTVGKLPDSAQRTKEYLDRCYAKFPFALPGAQAQKQIADREAKFAQPATAEKVATKRKIR